MGQTPQEQIQLVKKTAKSIVDLVEEGYEIVVGHGNGPQIGMINLAMDFAFAHGAKTPYMPFPECGAMSQGYIGYHLQQAIQFELKSRKLERQAVSVITQVVVDKEDKAFQTPVKPIGMFYTKQEADRWKRSKDLYLREGWRTWLSSCSCVSKSGFYCRIAGYSTIGQSKKYCNYSWRRRRLLI